MKQTRVNEIHEISKNKLEETKQELESERNNQVDVDAIVETLHKELKASVEKSKILRETIREETADLKAIKAEIKELEAEEKALTKVVKELDTKK
jgi:septal ring factor EnvC (AmiA/AmiB activator)